MWKRIEEKESCLIIPQDILPADQRETAPGMQGYSFNIVEVLDKQNSFLPNDYRQKPPHRLLVVVRTDNSQNDLQQTLDADKEKLTLETQNMDPRDQKKVLQLKNHKLMLEFLEGVITEGVPSALPEEFQKRIPDFLLKRGELKQGIQVITKTATPNMPITPPMPS